MTVPTHLTKIKISPYEWMIKPFKNPKVNNKPVDGYCYARGRIIAYASGLSSDRERVVVLHELMHALIHRAGGYKQSWLTRSREEWLVEEVTLSLMSLLKDNPSFVRWLLNDK